jgi:ABC-type Fe3+-hydroxamate transport system substrate-binding protein
MRSGRIRCGGAPGRRMTARAVTVMFAIGAAVALAGCSSGGSGPSSSSGTSSTDATTTTTASASTTVPTSEATGPSTTQPGGFGAAKQQWEEGAMADSADQTRFFNLAAGDLNSAITTGANHSDYAHAVQELQQLASLPETSETPTQQSEAQHDVQALNTFFGTSGLYQ